MNQLRVRAFFVIASILTATLSGAIRLRAQEPPQEPGKDTAAQTSEQLRHRADGERHGLLLETFAVTLGTKFLVRLQEELSSKGTQENAVFKVKTLEPLEAGSGFYLP
ncbi:MAG TPA: hypothetical protein VKB66_09205, partial [Candidatus Acidoferrum sp.]|nr:hypothetical protein [Candidatus Acidoferrum sp.]